MKVLIACEYSGRTREAFRARGHDVTSCDMLPAEDVSPHHVMDDVFNVIEHHGPFDLMIAHPPCTYLANSGARWLSTGRDAEGREGLDEKRWNQMWDAARFFAKLLRSDVPKVACENPIMHKWGRMAIESELGRDFTVDYVQPWWFGDPFFKATGFTLKGLPPLTKPATALTPPKHGTPEHKQWSAIHNMSPSPTRWKDRSRTYPGVAAAMAEQWG